MHKEGRMTKSRYIIAAMREVGGSTLLFGAAKDLENARRSTIEGLEKLNQYKGQTEFDQWQFEWKHLVGDLKVIASAQNELLHMASAG